METEEVDAAIDELDLRLERLRALYEQYFMGIERIEPGVLKKDVDRRIWQLRREKIRNTARRFRLQQIISRYNTFQQYWQRICREIENGTYKRHVIRAERRFGGQLLTIAARRRLGKGQSSYPPETAENNQEQPGQQLGELLDADVDLSAEARRALDEALGAATRASVQSNASSANGAQANAESGKGAREENAVAEPHRAEAFSAIDLDLNDPTLRVRDSENPVVQNPLARLGRAPRRAHTATSAEPGRARTAPAAETTGPTRQDYSAQMLRPPPKPGAAADASSRQKDPTKSAWAARPQPAAGAGLPRNRLEQLHDDFIRARRQTNENASVSLQHLEKSVRSAEMRLRQKHGNRPVDFRVVVKNGKAILKPVLR